MLPEQETVSSRLQTVREVVAIICGAGINLTIGWGLAIAGVNGTLFSQSYTPTFLFLAPIYFVIGIIYCTATSLRLRPKRFISPIYLQLVSSGWLAVALVSYLTLRNVSLLQISEESLLYFVIGFLLFMLVGIGQTPVVRYLVGLSGNKKDTINDRFLIDAKLEKVISILEDDDFLYAVDSDGYRQIRRDVYLFTTYHNIEQKTFVVVCKDSESQERTQLVAISYEQHYDIIQSTTRTSDVHEMRIGHLMKQLVNHKLDFKQLEQGDTDHLLPAESIAYDYSLRATESKILTLRSLEPHHIAIIIGISLMFGILLWAFDFKYITFELFATFLIFGAFAVIFDFLPLIKIRRRKTGSGNSF